MDFINTRNWYPGLRLEATGENESRHGQADRLRGDNAGTVAVKEKTMVATRQIGPAIWGALIGLFTFAILQAGTGLWWAAMIESRVQQLETRGSPQVENLMIQNSILTQKVGQMQDEQQRMGRSIEKTLESLQQHMNEQQRRQ